MRRTHDNSRHLHFSATNAPVTASQASHAFDASFEGRNFQWAESLAQEKAETQKGDAPTKPDSKVGPLGREVLKTLLGKNGKKVVDNHVLNNNFGNCLPSGKYWKQEWFMTEHPIPHCGVRGENLFDCLSYPRGEPTEPSPFGSGCAVCERSGGVSFFVAASPSPIGRLIHDNNMSLAFVLFRARGLAGFETLGGDCRGFLSSCSNITRGSESCRRLRLT